MALNNPQTIKLCTEHRLYSLAQTTYSSLGGFTASAARVGERGSNQPATSFERP